MGSMSDNTKPVLLLGCTPFSGHVFPILAIIKALVQRGYEVAVVCARHWQPQIEAIGCTFIPINGSGDFWDGEFLIKHAARNLLPPGPAQLEYDLEHLFVGPVPGQHAALQEGMQWLQENYSGRPIVMLLESLFHGALPIMCGAPGLKPAGTLGLGVIPLGVSSIDCAPFGPGQLPDTSPEGRARNKAGQEHIDELFLGKAKRHLAAELEQLGAKLPQGYYMDILHCTPDRFLQMCIPSAEYPRSDLPASIGYAGNLSAKRTSTQPYISPFTWWDEVAENKGGKDIVFVCQGTVSADYNDLVIPTLKALTDRPNTLVVVAVGSRGGSLPKDIHIPDNARVGDFIPYDEVLPYSAVFVTNGGYGGWQHAISNGTPCLMAGDGEDKPETCARAENSGMAVNLRTRQPTAEVVRTSVDEIISNPKYKKRALEMKVESESYDPVGIVAKTVDELAAGKKL